MSWYKLLHISGTKAHTNKLHTSMDTTAIVLSESWRWMELANIFLVKLDLEMRPNLKSFVNGILLDFGSLQLLFASIYSCPITKKPCIAINEGCIYCMCIEFFLISNELPEWDLVENDHFSRKWLPLKLSKSALFHHQISPTKYSLIPFSFRILISVSVSVP